MTTWTELSAGAVGVGGIPSGSTVTALRDNPVAIAEGATGAPRIHGRAAATPGNGLPVATISAANTLSIADTVEFEQVTSGTFRTGSRVTVLRFTMSSYTGSARLAVSVQRGSYDNPEGLIQYTSYNWYWKVGGVTAFTGFLSSSNSGTIPSQDITFTEGQVVTLEIDIGTSEGFGLGVSLSSVKANDGYVPQTLYKLNSE